MVPSRIGMATTRPPRLIFEMLPRLKRTILLRCTLALAVAAGATVGSHAQQARTANDGVYTDAQAARGKALYQQQCARCHGEALGGGNAPPLAGSEFITAWGAQP